MFKWFYSDIGALKAKRANRAVNEVVLHQSYDKKIASFTLILPFLLLEMPILVYCKNNNKQILIESTVNVKAITWNVLR